MSRRAEILGKHRAGIRSAASRHKAEAISLIGSVARVIHIDYTTADILGHIRYATATPADTAALTDREPYGWAVEMTERRI